MIAAAFPPGIVVAPVGHQPRYHLFYASLVKLLDFLPDGSCVQSIAGPDVTHNINEGIRRGLRWLPDAAWVWVIGDDHTFEPTVVQQLWLSRVPVVVPFVLKRSPPYSPVLYNKPVPGSPDFPPIEFNRLIRGLLRVEVAGGAGMLIRRDVLDAVGDPWFENRGTERQGEDIAFCLKLLDLDIPLYCNFDVQMGHITPVEIWPVFDPKQGWIVGMKNPAGEEVL